MKTVTTADIIEKEKCCAILCVDCLKQCKEYKQWLKQRRTAAEISQRLWRGG